MGYSCNVQAAYVTDAWQQACIDQTGSQNVFRVKGQRYFWEIGREQRDGAITGTVWRFLENDRCQRSGSFRIEPNGKVTRAPAWLKGHSPAQEDIAKRYWNMPPRSALVGTNPA